MDAKVWKRFHIANPQERDTARQRVVTLFQCRFHLLDRRLPAFLLCHPREMLFPLAFEFVQERKVAALDLAGNKDGRCDRELSLPTLRHRLGGCG